MKRPAIPVAAIVGRTRNACQRLIAPVRKLVGGKAFRRSASRAKVDDTHESIDAETDLEIEAAPAAVTDDPLPAEDQDDPIFDDEPAPKRKWRKAHVAMGAAAATAVAAVAVTSWWVLDGDPRAPVRTWIDIPRALQAALADGEDASAGGTDVIVNAVPAEAFADVALPRFATPLAPAPDLGLVEEGPAGPLPKIGSDGRLPWRVYAAPPNASQDRPRIAIVVTGLGLSRATTEAAVRKLPQSVTLAFDPHGENLFRWAAAARRGGHEVLVTVPMAAQEFPLLDPGPMSMSVDDKDDGNIRRLETILGRFPGHVGVLTSMGSALAHRPEALRPLLKSLHHRGLMLVEDGRSGSDAIREAAAHMGLPRVAATVRLDADPSPAAIDAQLARLEKTAREGSSVVAIAEAYPSTVKRIAAWAKALDKDGPALVPVSATVARAAGR